MEEWLWSEVVRLYNHPDFWRYAAIPMFAGLIGWGTNWLAIQMSLYPIEPIGWPPFFGWQGVIPSKSLKMATKFVDSSLAKLGSTSEIFEAMEADKMKDHMIKVVGPRLEEFIDDIMLEANPVLWENLPRVTKQIMYTRARWQLPRIAGRMMDEITARADELVDMRQMTIDTLSADKTLMNRMMLTVGKAEFDFVVKAGLWFGFPFGIIQMLAWVVHPAWYILPLFGLAVGAITNWMALTLILAPLEPRKIGPFVMQGLFIKRQNQISGAFAQVATRELLTVSHFIDTIMNGPNRDKAKRIVRRHIRPIIDEGFTKLAAQVALGPAGYADLKGKVEEAMIDLSTEVFDDDAFNAERGAQVEKMLFERMADMTPQEFSDLIRPAFKEDEWILIAVGAALGFVAGVGQLFWLFGEQFLKF